MGWKYVPGCNVARGAAGDNNKNQFGLSRKSGTINESECAPEKHPYKPPMGTEPYRVAFNSARPLPLSCGLAKSPVKSLRVRKEEVGGMVVKLNKQYCPEIDIVTQLAKGRNPSRTLQFNSPDLFPPPTKDTREEPCCLHYMEPTRLVNSSKLHSCLTPSTPWRYSVQHQLYPCQRPFTQINDDQNNATDEVHDKLGRKETMDTSCQTICESEAQTDIVLWGWDAPNQLSQDLESSNSSLFSSEYHASDKDVKLRKTKKQFVRRGKIKPSVSKHGMHKPGALAHKPEAHVKKRVTFSNKRRVAKKPIPTQDSSPLEANDPGPTISLHIPCSEVPSSCRGHTVLEPPTTLHSTNDVGNKISLVPEKAFQIPRSQLIAHSTPQGEEVYSRVSDMNTNDKDNSFGGKSEHAHKSPVLHISSTSHGQNENGKFLVPMSDKICQTSTPWVQNDLMEDAVVNLPQVPLDPAPTFGTCVTKTKGQVQEQKERNSLDSLEELEKLIEEQHKELVSRGILPPDEMDLGLHSPIEPRSHQSLNTQFLHDFQSSHDKFSELSCYNRGCPSEIDELEARAKASRLENLPERTQDASFGQELFSADNQAPQSPPDALQGVCNLVPTPRSHRSISRQAERECMDDVSEEAASSSESWDSAAKLEADPSTVPSDTEPNSSEVAEMVASAAAATATHDSILRNTSKARTYKVDICKEQE